jgi:hypothetical protein
MSEKVMQSAQYGRRFMELGEMFLRTGTDEHMSESERIEEMTRLLHVMRARLDQAAATLERTEQEARELVAA